MSSSNATLAQGSFSINDELLPRKIEDVKQYNMSSPQALPEQSHPYAPNARDHFAVQQPAQYHVVASPPSMYGGWGGSGEGYGLPSPPTMGQSGVMHNFLGGAPAVPNATVFPDSPPMMDASQMLMSPSRFRKRRHLSPLISGYMDPFKSPTMQQIPGASPYLRRMAPMPKIPVSPQSYSAGSSPKSLKSATLILPCFFDQNNQLRTHGPHMGEAQTGPSAYWDDFRRNMNSFLEEAKRITDDTTIIEIKQLLRKFGINATGKKHILTDRVRQLEAYMSSQQEQEKIMKESVTLTADGREVSPPAAGEEEGACSHLTAPLDVTVPEKENILPSNSNN